MNSYYPMPQYGFQYYQSVYPYQPYQPLMTYQVPLVIPSFTLTNPPQIPISNNLKEATPCTISPKDKNISLSSCPSQLRVDTHRSSCHICGNVRIKKVLCSRCPYTFCTSCVLKMKAQYGNAVFAVGCPVCERVCCCSNHSKTQCNHSVHCYKKCLKRRYSEVASSPCTNEGM